MLLALMARQPVSKELWTQLQPLIPVFTPSAKGGARKLGVSDEAALNGILFVLHTGIPWADLPLALGYGRAPLTTLEFPVGAKSGSAGRTAIGI